MDVEIAAPGLGDIETVTQLWKALVDDQRVHGTRLRVDANEVHARSWLSTRMSFDGIRVAMVDGDIVGFVTFGLMRDQFERIGGDGVVHNLYVKPASRNRGIGTALLERAESILADRGADYIRLEVLLSNHRAATFYQEHGYTPYRTTYRKAFSQTDTDFPYGDKE